MQRSPLKPKFNKEISLADAAANAEFAEKKRVWVPDQKEGYLSGWVAKENGEEWDVVCNNTVSIFHYNIQHSLTY